MIGRTKEQEQLRRAYESESSEFVAIYGRRRVGKTYLIRETFNYSFTFQHSGLANSPLGDQLHAWQSSLKEAGFPKAKAPKTWLEAFDQLKEVVKASAERKKVVFIDEMPWMDTPRSKFVMALEHFWNSFASARKDILLIICGSATSWIINNVFKNHGGLHNRVTCRIHLSPFTLHECESYVRERRLDFSKYQLLIGYMVMGGVPFYWSQLQRGLSLDQNIDEMFFSADGALRYEFQQLYSSLFKHPETYVKVISVLGQKRAGMTREEIISADSSLTDNGKLTQVLEDLEHSGFICRYNMIGKKVRSAVFQLIDNFTLFYFRFMHHNAENDARFWTHHLDTPLYHAWCGLAFERVCFTHVRQIRMALGIEGIASNVYAWQVRDDALLGPGAQIDMLIDRSDKTINLCEMKFSTGEYRIDKDYAETLRRKKSRFAESTKTRKALHLTLITTYGLVHNAYWGDVQKEVTAEDLFRE